MRMEGQGELILNQRDLNTIESRVEMTDINIDFTRIMLKKARADAKKHFVEIPKGLTTRRCSGFSSPYYEVWGDGYNGLLWKGNADNAYDAKAKFIGKLIDKAEE